MNSNEHKCCTTSWLMIYHYYKNQVMPPINWLLTFNFFLFSFLKNKTYLMGANIVITWYYVEITILVWRYHTKLHTNMVWDSIFMSLKINWLGCMLNSRVNVKSLFRKNVLIIKLCRKKKEYFWETVNA